VAIDSQPKYQLERDGFLVRREPRLMANPTMFANPNAGIKPNSKLIEEIKKACLVRA